MDCSFLNPVVLSILLTETVERFAYFGFRAVLTLYFVQSLKYNEDTAIALYAYVTCLAYASPLVGATLADGPFGRYQTILWFGWAYTVGLLILTIGAFLLQSLQLRRIISFVGLFLVCIGTGGIKPCVSAFGADQVIAGLENSSSTRVTENKVEIHVSQSLSERTSTEEKLRAFFASFYFCINLGAVTSISIIPIVRYHFGFGASFAMPTVFITMAMLTFLSKRREYVHMKLDGSLLTTFKLCFWLMRKNLTKLSWLVRSCPCILPKRSPIEISDNDGASVPNQQVSDARQAVQVMPVLAMLPIFWMLYDQQSSVWTLQANRMNLHGIQPEQLNIINPIEIMVFIPLFEQIIYPNLKNVFGFQLSYLHRMQFGMVLTAISFSLSGLLETWVQKSTASSVSVFWQLPQITILAIAEILVSVTGLEFAYSTSPERLKAFLMGLYLATTSIGDLLGGVLYSTIFATLNRATVMHICSILMLTNLAFFCLIGRGYSKNSLTMPSPDFNEKLDDSFKLKSSHVKKKNVDFDEIELIEKEIA